MSRIGNDYIRDNAQRPNRARWRWLAMICVLPLMVGAFAMTIQDPDSALGDSAHSAVSDLIDAPAGNADNPAPDAILEGAAPISKSAITNPKHSAASPKAPDWIHIKIQSGDTLSLAFERHQLSYRDSLAIAHLEQYGDHFTRGLRAGDQFKVRANDSGHVLALDYPLGPIRTLEIRSTDDGYTAQVARADVTRREAHAIVTINESFYVDALEAGLYDGVIMDLAFIFGWQIDFVHEIREGDQFIVVYEELYSDGRKVRDGDILAAQFTGQNAQISAIRYTNAEGESNYYTPDGQALERAFRRVPLDDHYYVSSPFSLARDHPILNTIRAHEGTDFAAPTGTPIHATGDGRIQFRGVNGGYGKMVVIDHGHGYTTRYGHMSRFASGQRVGSHVDRGEIIGYVGMTGLATGPHVHYEFRVDGVPRNPQTIDLPGAPPLPASQMADFKLQAKPLLAQLDSLDGVRLAINQTAE